MAYFLDPELDALTKGSTRQRTIPLSTPGQRRPNKYGKRCHKCSTWVAAGAGYLDKDSGAWVVYCTDCP